MARFDRPTRALFVVSLLICAFPNGPLAETSGGLRGVVSDESGDPLEGAAVAVSSAAGGVAGRGAVTDLAGSFRILSLPPGTDYQLVASYPGFAPVSLSDVVLPAGQIVTVRITLQRQTTYRERIEVRASPPVVQLETTTTQTRISSEFLDALPILGRNYQDILSLAPGVTDVNGTGNPNIHGARDTDVITLVDGVSTTDPLTGKFGAQLNIESIQEIEIKTSGATAEFGRAQGGFANIITKSGGNDFKGTFKFYWRGQTLDGDGAGIDDPRLHSGVGESGLRDLKFNDFLPFLSLEGPIVRDRAWFFLANEYVQTQEPVNALTQAFVTEVREYREFGKLTWQASANHRVSLSLNYDPQETLNQGLNSFTREESGYTVRQGGPILTLKGVSVLSPNVSFETAMSYFNERPSLIATMDPDTNHNGLLYLDRNRNGFIELTEGDSGEDYDRDGRFDVFERLRGSGWDDIDEDKRRTQPGNWVNAGSTGGCEGFRREDLNCDGILNNGDNLHQPLIDEDYNHNGTCDPGEDLNRDGACGLVNEDRNGDGFLDDLLFVQGKGPFSGDPNDPTNTLYPYGHATPIPADRDYSIDQRRGVTSGPYYEDFSDRRRRFTLRQDLAIYVPDYFGSHDLKIGGVLERENFDRITDGRPILAPIIRMPREGVSTLRTLVPAQRTLENQATSLSTGLYVQDNFKPFPNLSIGLGLRFDREATDSFGYSFFDPATERIQYDRLSNLFGAERGFTDLETGNNDGLISNGYCSDPIFQGFSANPCQSNPQNNPVVADLDGLRRAALSRLTRHHTEAAFTSNLLRSLHPDVVKNGEIDPQRLVSLGVLPQVREPFRLTNNNLAPRLSVAWDPWADGRSKLFATWGRYYDKLFLSTVVGEEGPDSINRYYLLDPTGVTGVGTPNHNVGRIISKAPPSTTQVDRGLQTPWSDEFTLGFERELAPELALSVTYINRRFRAQLQDVDVNHTLRTKPDGQLLDALGKLVPLADDSAPSVRLPDGRPDLYIHNLFFNQVLRVGNSNEASYHGIELAILKRLARRWEFQGSYSYSRAVGAAEDFQSSLGNDPSTVESEFGYLDYDQRHVVKLNTITFLPGDWQLGVSATWSSGLPYSVISRFFAADNVDYQQFRTRYGYTSRTPGGGANGSFVTLGRNSMRNDAVYDFNVRAKKALVIGKTAAAVFLEVFNLLNTDDLRIRTFEPTAPDFFNTTEITGQGALQLDATRRFGRRFQVGFQMDF
jgi:hypothetical protein